MRLNKEFRLRPQRQSLAKKKKNLSEFQQRSMHAPLVIFYGDSSAIEPQISALKTIHSCF